MDAPPEDAQRPDPGRDGEPPRGGWGHLQLALRAFGAALSLLGWGALAYGSLALGSPEAEAWSSLFLLAWGAAPIALGLLLIPAARSLRKPGAEAGAWLVVAAVAALAGLAWVAATVALLLGRGR
jgi:hypothetical protein